MKKRYLTHTSVMFSLAAGLVIAVPSLLRQTGSGHRSGVLLLNGHIEGTEVAIGTKLSGRIARVNAQEGQEVKAGDLLVELEANSVQAEYDQARANVRQARHNLENATEQAVCAREQLEKAKIGKKLVKQQIELNINLTTSTIQETQAGIDQAKALLNKARAEYDQAANLQEKKAASDLEFTFAKEALTAQEAAVRVTELKQREACDTLELAKARRAEIRMQEHDLASMESTVRQAQATVGVARTRLLASEAGAKMFELRLKDTKIVAPCDGIVVTRMIEPGEIVPAGASLLIVVDFDKLFLKGYLPNNEMFRIKPGNPARLYLDAFPDKYFEVQVTTINQRANSTSGRADMPGRGIELVSEIELKINNALRIFKPGMPADAVIKYDPSAPWCQPEKLR